MWEKLMVFAKVLGFVIDGIVEKVLDGVGDQSWWYFFVYLKSFCGAFMACCHVDDEVWNCSCAGV